MDFLGDVLLVRRRQERKQGWVLAVLRVLDECREVRTEAGLAFRDKLVVYPCCWDERGDENPLGREGFGIAKDAVKLEKLNVRR